MALHATPSVPHSTVQSCTASTFSPAWIVAMTIHSTYLFGHAQTCWISRRTGLHVAVEWSFWTVLVPWELHLLHCANYCCFHLCPVGVDSYTWHYHLFIKLKSQKITCEQSANANNVYCVRLCSMQAAPRYQHLSLFLCEQQHLVLWLFVSFLFSLRQLCHL